MISSRAYAFRIGGVFLLLNVLRMRVRGAPYRDRIPTMREMLGSSALHDLSMEPTTRADLVPDYLTKDPDDLTDDEQKLLRHEFYTYCNMPVFKIRAWLSDPRVVDGHGTRQQDPLATKMRLRSLLAIKSGTTRGGSGWTPKGYKVAQQCVFVAKSLFHPRRVDYIVWATLKNFGVDWEWPVGSNSRRRLPRKTRLAAQLALVKHQITGKRRTKK